MQKETKIRNSTINSWTEGWWGPCFSGWGEGERGKADWWLPLAWDKRQSLWGSLTKRKAVFSAKYHFLGNSQKVLSNPILNFKYYNMENDVMKHEISEVIGEKAVLGCSSWRSAIGLFLCRSASSCTAQPASLRLIPQGDWYRGG